MRLIILESPYSGDIERNVDYARRAVADALGRGESPIASHLLYTQPGILRDSVPADRELGVAAGLAWVRVADATVVYHDLGVTEGMKLGIATAARVGRPVEYREIGAEDPDKRQATLAWFAEQMMAKLNANRHKGDDWAALGDSRLLQLLGDEVEELAESTNGADIEAIIAEAADVANFAMMIADAARAGPERLRERLRELATLSGRQE